MREQPLHDVVVQVARDPVALLDAAAGRPGDLRAATSSSGDRGLVGERRGHVELGVGERRGVLVAPEEQRAHQGVLAVQRDHHAGPELAVLDATQRRR